MFSKRLPSSIELNRIARALDAARAAHRPLIDLTESNPTGVGLPYASPAILSALADSRALEYQPTPQGLEEARVAIADYYRRRGHRIDPAHVWLTSSTSEAYAHLFKLLCDPGDSVMAAAPSYPLFELLASLESVRVESYPLRYHGGWDLDLHALEQRIDASTRALLVVNPNNPTGSFLRSSELEALEALAAAHGLALVSDEVFADYARAGAPDRVDTLVGRSRALTFSLSGLSKVAGLPQLKLAWIVVSGPPALVARAEARLELILDTFLSVGQPVQHAAARLLALAPALAGALLARVEANRARVAEAVRGTSLELLAAEGGWYAIVRVPRVLDEESWVLTLLEEDGVVVQPGFFFDFSEEAYLVVSLLVPEERLENGLRRLVARVERVTRA